MFIIAHSSNYNPFETKANPLTSSSSSSTKIVQTIASNMKNIESRKGNTSCLILYFIYITRIILLIIITYLGISSCHSKIHKGHKIKRKLKDINLYLDKDDVIGSQRLGEIIFL